MPLLYWFEAIRTPVLDICFSLITHMGEETFFLVMALLVFWCLDKKKGYYLMAIGFTGTIANQFLKLACRVPRPWVRDPGFTIVESARDAATGYSFPSGHTQTAVGIYGGLAASTRNRLRWPALALAVLIPLSRMYLGVHTPWDVGVSALIGLGLIFLFRPLLREKASPLSAFAVMLLLAGLFTLYVEFWPFPADIDPINYAEGVKNAYTLLGALAGALAAVWLDQRLTRFDTRAPLPGQILKLLLGLALTLAVKAGLKALLTPIGHPAAHAIRYFLVVLFAGGLWPMTFPLFARFGRH